MNRINFIVALSLVLLVSSSSVKGQTTKPGYDNIHMEKAMDPLHKIKLALLVKDPVQQPQFSRSCNNWSYNNRISQFRNVTPFDPIGDLHKVKLDYNLKPNMGLLSNRFQY